MQGVSNACFLKNAMDFVSTEWAKSSDFPMSIGESSAAAINDKLYFFGGLVNKKAKSMKSCEVQN